MRHSEKSSPENSEITVEHLVPQDGIDAAHRLIPEFGSATESIRRSINYLAIIMPYTESGGELYFERVVRSNSVFPFEGEDQRYYYRFTPLSSVRRDTDSPSRNLIYRSSQVIEDRLSNLATKAGLTHGEALAQAVLIAEELLAHENKGEQLVLKDPKQNKFTYRFAGIGLTQKEKMKERIRQLKVKAHLSG